MFKKFKSLLLAGVMALCMCGSAFANGNGNDGCQAPGLRGEHNGNSHHINNITEQQWNDYMAEFNAKNAGNFQIVPSGNKWKVMRLCDNKQIEVIHVEFNKCLTDEEKESKMPKPEFPDVPGTDPETGDASTLMLLGTVALSVAGLFILRDKKDEE